MRSLIVSIMALLFLAAPATAATYMVDKAHTQVQFAVKHLVFFTVRGVFTDFEGMIKADPKKKTIQSAEGTIKVASIDTREKKRDDHLKSADFFNAADYPTIKFKATRVKGSGSNVTMDGKITIRGITKNIKLRGGFVGEIKDPWGNTKGGFAFEGKINRKDFGMKWNKTMDSGKVVVGNEVTLTIEVEAARK